MKLRYVRSVFLRVVNGAAGSKRSATARALFRYRFFDKYFNLDPTRSGIRQANNPDQLAMLSAEEISFNTTGYFYVYVTNESPTDVSFDNLLIKHYPGFLLQENHYYPFGLLNKALSSDEQTGFHQRYGFNGKEFENGLDWRVNDFGARMYDPVLGRWDMVDPHASNYWSWSPYHFAANNPVSMIDPNGMDWYEFDQAGAYKRKLDMDGEDRVMIHTVEKIEDGSVKESYKFADFSDSQNDPKQIERGEINRLISVSEDNIQSMLGEQGAFESGKLNFALQSMGGGDFDYSFSVLPRRYPDVEFDKVTLKSNALFLAEGDNTVHNYMNFGNYLWAATGFIVGYDYSWLQSGAHVNSLLMPMRNGYPPQWDSYDDQRSIILGAYHAKKRNYRNLKK